MKRYGSLSCAICVCVLNGLHVDYWNQDEPIKACSLTSQGIKDPELTAIGRAGPTSKHKKGSRNISRNFHSYLEKAKKILPVEVSTVRVRVRVRRPKVRTIQSDYPMITLESWGRFLLENSPRFLLGGFHITERKQYMTMFQRFWEQYKHLDENHIVYTQFQDYSHLIPYCVHGDEGRGKGKAPIMITTYQPLIGVHGEDFTNIKGYLGLHQCELLLYIFFHLEHFKPETAWGMFFQLARHSFTTRFLAWMMPSRNYAPKDATMDDFTTYMVSDLSKVFSEGVKAASLHVIKAKLWDMCSHACLEFK